MDIFVSNTQINKNINNIFTSIISEMNKAVLCGDENMDTLSNEVKVFLCIITSKKLLRFGYSLNQKYILNSPRGGWHHSQWLDWLMYGKKSLYDYDSLKSPIIKYKIAIFYLLHKKFNENVAKLIIEY